MLVIGNTNCKDDLDPALLRSGRFSHQIEFTLPAEKDIQDIVIYYLKKNNLIIDKNNYENILSLIIKEIQTFEERNVAVIIEYINQMRESINNKITLENFYLFNKKINLLANKKK